MKGESVHRLVIGAKAYSSEGSALIDEMIRTLAKAFNIEAVSSIYKVHGQHQRPAHVHDLRSYSIFEALTAAILVRASQEPVAALAALRHIESKLSNEVMRRSVSLNLFFYDDLAMITPELTLPHPDFHLYPENVLPVAEVIPDLRHPVLRKSVRELAHKFAGQQWGEFHAASKSALDFYPPRTKPVRS